MGHLTTGTGLCSPFTTTNLSPLLLHRVRGACAYQGAGLSGLGLLAEEELSPLRTQAALLLHSTPGSSAVLQFISFGFPSTFLISAAPGPLCPPSHLFS